MSKDRNTPRVIIRAYGDLLDGLWLAEVDLITESDTVSQINDIRVAVFSGKKSAKKALDFARATFRCPIYDGHGNLIPDDFNGKEIK